jgi:TatD DNase family protein
MYIDTHTHLYDEQLMIEEDAMIQRALDAGVNKMYMPNCDSSTIEAMMQLAKKFPENCYPMMGLHPTYVKDNYKDELQIVKDWLERETVYAIGEIGIDKYWDLSHLPQQIEAFEYQIDLALQYQLPIVIHSREATQDCIDVVKKKQNGTLKGIFHCFGGSLDEARQIIDLGMYMGIGGVVTFKKSSLPEVIKETGLDNIVLETDAPYLAPVPYRGKRNESSYIPLIAERIGNIMGMSGENIGRITTENALKIFRTK